MKENCYDVNKYYSKACEDYLQKIGFDQSKKNRGNRRDKSKSRSPIALRLTPQDGYSQSKGRSKTVESEDSLKDILQSK